MKRPIVPPALGPVYETWHFAPAMQAGDFLFCSGIVGTSPDGSKPQRDGLEGAEATLKAGDAELGALVAVRDPQAQFETAFEALDAILNEAGARLADVVELTSYHVDIATHMPTFMAVRDRYLSAPWPAWTAVGVSGLIVPGGLVELRAVALRPNGD